MTPLPDPAGIPIPSSGLDDRVVVVTGGAQGVGRGIVQAVLQQGGRVAIGDIDREAGAACLAELDAGRRAACHHLDVSREASVKRFMAWVLRRFGRIDGLVNNAGIAGPGNGPLEELTLGEWRRRLATNLDGAFLCSKHALRALREAGGAIVNITSTRALQSEPHTEAYAASKGGLLAFTHALAISAGPRVRVNAVSPGWIAVEGWRKPSARRSDALTHADHAQHPAGRVGVPPDIGATVCFLLSPAAAFITAQNMVVDGGMVKKMQYT